MQFESTQIEGAWRLLPERRTDERGYFARVWCAEEMRAHGVAAAIAQINTSVSPRRHTLRGMHFQVAPHEETKVVRCTRGRIFDVVVDLRAGSASYRRWIGVELDALDGGSLVVPPGCAHGFLTLTDDCEVMYGASVPYAPSSARGVRFDDPELAIEWPAAPAVVSAADRQWPLLAPAQTLNERQAN